MAKLKQKTNTYLKRDQFATRKETLERLFAKWKPQRDLEKINIEFAVGRICGENIYSHNTLPVERMAAADGVAVRYSDFKDGIPDFSNWKEGVDYIATDMGDDFDDNFDTVLWVEDFTFSPEGKITSIIPSDPVTTGHLIKQRGDFLRENELILKKGDLDRKSVV